MCLGRSASMKQVYENQVAANSTSTEFKERLRKEVSEELNVVHEAETAAKDAKNKFKQLEKSNSFQQKSTVSNTNLNTNSNNSTPRSTPVHHPKVNTFTTKRTDQPIEVIKCSEPGEKEEFHINVNQLQERYRFFEQQLNSNNNQTDQIDSKTTDSPRRPIQLPTKAIDDCVVETPNDQIKRDPNIVRSSDVIDDLPKNEIAKKMLNVFQQLEKSNNNNVTKELNGTPNRDRPPVRCMTPPKDYKTNNQTDEIDAPVNGHDKDIGE